MLLDILRRWDMTPVDLGHAADSREAVTAALDRGAAQADAILTSGGASAGDEDHVSATLKAAGALEIWRIAVKPGRPLAIGNWQGRPVFGLPGNPVAAFVCTLVFARPVLLRLAGAPWQTPAGPHPPRRLRQDQARRPPRIPPRPPRRPRAPWKSSPPKARGASPALPGPPASWNWRTAPAPSARATRSATSPSPSFGL